jgi:divalent metal cation (Fe/Co/Zn/Cd) transporter
MHADAKRTKFCTYLSGILLGGLSLNAPFGLWSVDPVAGLVMVPIIAKEGIEGLQVKPAMIAQHRGTRQRPLNAIPSSHGA